MFFTSQLDLATVNIEEALNQNHQTNPQQNMQRPRGDLDTNSATATSSSRATYIQIATGSQLQPTASTEIGGAAADSLVRYRECLKNHAANMGTHVLDGCGEFMPSGEEGTPGALKCAACDCHRSFHRKEINGRSQYVGSFCYTHHINNSSIGRSAPQLTSGFSSQPSIQQHHGYSTLGKPRGPTYQNPAAMVTGVGTRVTAESSSEDLSMYQSAEAVQTSAQPQLRKTRFRTKFTKEQKDKMMEFAEMLGWKIVNQEEQQVQQFCSELGVRRQAFVVWNLDAQQ